ncbi:MAG TPA: GNAT family N-acetyltransferase [Gammaproteobacteria bacterium]
MPRNTSTHSRNNTAPVAASRIVTAHSLGKIAPAEWNSLTGADHPFISHVYLNALEQSGSANTATGWEPVHQLALDGEQTSGALPLYSKHHSYGEFVFDFAWADACERAGLDYYPKLLTAVPFTPVAGPRLLGDEPGKLIDAGLEIMRDGNYLSWHVLFPETGEHERWQAHGFLPRVNTRFVWSDAGYGDFDGFLAALKQKRRKEIRRERKQVADAGVRFRVLHGRDLDADKLAEIYRCYARTYHLRGQIPYLTETFFSTLSQSMPDAIVVFLGERDDETLAAAICLRDAQTLYGRWWGTLIDLPGLHFEACYYQGIAYCLENGLKRYDPGVQGEHKLARGFAPETCWSFHHFNHPGLESAVREALARETSMLEHYIEDCRQHLPFRSA